MNTRSRTWIWVIVTIGLVVLITWIVAQVTATYLYPQSERIVSFTSAPSRTPTQQTLVSPSQTPFQSLSCTYTRAYWQLRPELYPVQLIIGAEVINQDTIQALLAGPGADCRSALFQETTAAFLNLLYGATSSEIEAALDEAYRWLVENPGGLNPTNVSLQACRILVGRLQAFNLGTAGPGHCPDEALPATSTATITPVTPSSTPTASRTATPTGMLSPTATPSPTATLSWSPTPTPSITPTPRRTIIVPTRTDTREPSQPTSTPTNIPLPPTPTSTPLPPSPTSTSIPPSPTNTPQPPTPTHTPQPPTPTNTPLPPSPTVTPVPSDTPTATEPPPAAAFEAQGVTRNYLFIFI